MRIVGGEWRGRQLEAPDGRSVTRPTTDRMRESIASMILSARGLDLAGAHVLDAFAGSGAMGLELLSRGAATCTFVDADRGAAARVRRNCKALGALDRTQVVRGDALRLATSGLPGAPFHVVFLDPPYAMGADVVSSVVAGLAASGQLAPGCVVCYERAAEAPGLTVAGLAPARTKKHGITCVDLAVYGGGEAADGQ